MKKSVFSDLNLSSHYHQLSSYLMVSNRMFRASYEVIKSCRILLALFNNHSSPYIIMAR